MTETDKFIIMTGFAKRAGKIVYGYDNLKKTRAVKLFAVSGEASQNLKDDMCALAGKYDRPLVYADSFGALFDGNIKAFGIKDANMAKAVVDYIEHGQTNYKIEYGKRR